MIYKKERFPPTSAEKKENRLRGDESFSNYCSSVFGRNLPEYEGRKLDFNSMILLNCKNVEPHKDPYVVNSARKEPKKRAAIFWLTEGELHIQCGDFCEKMKSGDYIVFDDSIMHCVVADKKWRGAAAQYI